MPAKPTQRSSRGALLGKCQSRDLARKARLFFSLAMSLILLTACFFPPYISPEEGEKLGPGMEKKIEKERQRAFNSQIVSLAATQGSGENLYRLGPGDVVEISIFGVEALSDIKVRIGGDGYASLPLVGPVKLGGLTVREAQKAVAKAYRAYINNPKVTFYISEYHNYRVSVLGEVKKPSVYELKGPRSLLDVIAQAGGVTDDADHTITVVRTENGTRRSMIIDLDQLIKGKDPTGNIMVQANDVIYVPLAGSYFVDGMVRHPGAYHLTEPVTLSKAIAIAGGMVGGADIKKVGIYRTTKEGTRKPIIVNLEDIRAGKLADPEIQEGDVILVGKDRLQVLVSKFLGFFGVHYNAYPYRFGVGR